jgi:Tfp pilus assembly protein PilN
MLRTNLSTRPFYNERIVHLLLGAAGLIVVVLTAFNAIWIVTLSRQNTDFSALINRDHGEAQRLSADAQRIRAGINQDALKTTVQATESTNKLIDQRTFSWTEFFNRIEDTLPPDVMITEVRPSFEQGRSIVAMTVLAKRSEDIDEFIGKLEATGAFHDVLTPQVETTDDGIQRASLRAEYIDPAAQTDKPETGPPAQRPAAAPVAKPPDATAPAAGASASARGERGR